MRPNVLKKHHDERPFVPFAITVSTCESFVVPRPDVLFLGKHARVLVLRKGREYHPVQLAYVHVVETAPLNGSVNGRRPRRSE